VVGKAEPPKPELPTQDKPQDKAKPEPPAAEPARAQLAEIPAPMPDPPKAASASGELPFPPSPATTPSIHLGEREIGKAAHHTSAGDTSLVRALGLKVTRVVIDPGHGGQDAGTQGAKGLLEKELVLDVAKRVGKLIEDRIGAEVIYTRTDDTFIPLEGRTALANEKRADLFLSIHANSSPLRGIAGVETYYLNFTDVKDSLDLASRENASSEKSISELRDIIQKITLHDKAEESREFAGRLQSSLYTFSSKNFPNSKNRGVKKAPFVVLIGANMPSVLAEIGFLTNAREEILLKRPDYRQRMAEALFRGISKYADGLSHFQVAQGTEKKDSRATNERE
jgi:N-acetylmuramoyl-L-alanine amidase